MADEAQLSWERRAAPYAAAAAFGSVAFQVASFAAGAPANKDAPGRGDPLPVQRTLENFHEHSGALLTSQLLLAVANFLAAGALFYLFHATRARRKELPRIVQWLLVIGPVLLVAAVAFNWTGINKAADNYADPASRAQISAKPTKGQRDDAVDFCKGRREEGCVTRRTRQEAVAKKLVDDNRSPVAAAAGIGGQLALGFSFVMIALNAMRAGLMSRFMGILGVIVGALMVLPLLPTPVVQIFWLGGLGVLFLNRWPSGRGPAWETGEAEPWPVPEGRGGLFAPRPQEDTEPEPEPGPEPEQVNRPRSRKRKKRR